MNRSLVILAAVIIFAAGAATGGSWVRAYAPRTVVKTHVAPPLPIGPERRQEYLSRLDRELHLAPEQHQKIEAILEASQERMKALWGTIEPQTKEEYQRTRREISEVLTPEQREKKKQMRQHRQSDTNKPAGNAPAKGEAKPQACARAKCKTC